MFIVRLPEIYKLPSIDLVPEPAKIIFPKFEVLIIWSVPLKVTVTEAFMLVYAVPKSQSPATSTSCKGLNTGVYPSRLILPLITKTPKETLFPFPYNFILPYSIPKCGILCRVTPSSALPSNRTVLFTSKLNVSKVFVEFRKLSAPLVLNSTLLPIVKVPVPPELSISFLLISKIKAIDVFSEELVTVKLPFTLMFPSRYFVRSSVGAVFVKIRLLNV